MNTVELGDLSRMHDENPAGMEDLAFEQPHDVAHEHDVLDVPSAEVGRSIMRRGVVAFGAYLTAMIGASLLRGESPLTALEVLAQGVGIGRPRLVDRIRPLAVGAAVLFGGALVLGAVDRGLRKATMHAPGPVGRITSGVGIPVLAFAIDQIVMKDGFVPRLAGVLGPGGVLAKYAAMGVVSAVGSAR